MTKKTTAKKTTVKTPSAKKPKAKAAKSKTKSTSSKTTKKAAPETKSAGAAQAANDAPVKTTAATSPTSTAPETDSPNVPMIPPIIMLLFIMAGITLDWLIPMDFGHGWGALGLLLAAAGFGGVLYCKNMFTAAGTNISPDEPTLVLIEDGPYQYTRNPIYICFLALFAGLAMMADAPLMLLMTGGLWYVLDQKIVAREEEYLENKFGEDYVEYKHLRKRWL